METNTLLNQIVNRLGLLEDWVRNHRTVKHPDAFAIAFPIGYIFMSTSPTNPGTTLGYGTWTAYAAGRMLIGVGTSDAAYTAGSTGGESTHKLVSSEMPSHTHIQNSHNHIQDAHTHIQDAHSHTVNTGSAAGTPIVRIAGSPGASVTPITPSSTIATNQNTTATNQAATATNQNTGGDGTHNNMPPYIVVYMWTRTA
jgi:microcystin-dependent protein